jgi:hypothetical protein
MATSHYFRNYSGVATNEQRLMEDVVTESIAIMGHDVYYIPREGFNPTDALFGENPQSKFERAYHMEMYLANVEGYEGDGDFFSKFGLEIRDTSNFVVSRLTFEKYVPSSLAIRPREGDLIYIPVMQKLFEIKFVEEELMFFSLGKRTPYIYELRCELFRYAQESINTGVEEIDDVERTSAYTIQFNVNNGMGNYNIGETIYQGANLAYSTASAEVANWDPILNKLNVINIVGNVTANANVIGQTSGTVYNLQAFDDLEDFAEYDMYDNRNIQTEADAFIDFSDVNPFGRP